MRKYEKIWENMRKYEKNIKKMQKYIIKLWEKYKKYAKIYTIIIRKNIIIFFYLLRVMVMLQT